MILKANLKYNICWLILMVAGFYLMNTLILVGVIDSFLENMLVTIGINIILAVGLNLVIGFAGQFSLGHAGFMAVGAYATAIIISKTPTAGAFYVSIIVGVVIAIVAALVVGIPTLRLRGDYLAIATMGAAEIIRIVINNLKITNGPSGMFNIPQFATWPVVYIMICVTTIIIVNFIHSRGGRAAMAVREDEIAAESMGINVFKWKLAAFVLGAATAAVAGSMQASYLQTIAPSNFNIMESIAILIIVVLGGVGSVTGSFVAAIILGIVDTALQNFGALRMVIYAVVLILIMIFKPSGIMGTWELSFKRLFTKKNEDGGQVMSTLLKVEDLVKNFGGLTAVSDVTMQLNDDELVALIGPNGAGKTTLFNLLTGVIVPSSGSITFRGPNGTIPLNGKKAYKIANLGMARTFQNIRLFKELSVLDNVLIAMTAHYKEGFVQSVFRLPKFYRTEAQIRQEAIELLKIFDLQDDVDKLAKNLPYGIQRRLEIVRGLAMKPKVLFLDEPAAGMNPEETADLTRLIRQIQREFHITVLLIEHDMSLVMNLAERIYVLDHGSLLAEGTPAQIQQNPAVIKAYLGEEA